MSEIRHGFHEELKDLEDKLIRLAGLATQSIHSGTKALLESDLTAADSVIESDGELDDLTRDIESQSFTLISRQQPMASDLRVIISIMRADHELERIGDLMVNIAKATRRLYPYQLDAKLRGLIQRMREQATAQLDVAVNAFCERDASQAAALADMDDTMDELQKDLFRWIFASQASEESIQRLVQVALIGRYFERIADHAVNVGERVTFMVTGEERQDPHHFVTP